MASSTASARLLYFWGSVSIVALCLCYHLLIIRNYFLPHPLPKPLGAAHLSNYMYYVLWLVPGVLPHSYSL